MLIFPGTMLTSTNLFFDKDVKVAVVQAAMPTTTPATQDVTLAGFGTVKAAYFLWGLTGSDGIPQPGNRFSVGATDGTKQWVVAEYVGDAIGTTIAKERSSSAQVMMHMSAAGINAEASFDSFITDGVRVDWTTVNADAHNYYVVLIGGNDTSVKVDFPAIPATDTTTVTVGFQPEVLLTPAHANLLDTHGAASFWIHGWATYDGSTLTRKSVHAQVNDGSNATVAKCNISELGIKADFQNVNVSNFTETGFDLVSTADFSAFKLPYLALGGLNGFKLIMHDSPTSTGSEAITGIGFKPKAVLVLPTSHDTVDGTQEVDGTGAGYGFGVGTAIEEACISLASEDAADPTNEQTMIDTKLIHIDADDGTELLKATLTSLDVDGCTLEWATVGVVKHKVIMLFLA